MNLSKKHTWKVIVFGATLSCLTIVLMKSSAVREDSEAWLNLGQSDSFEVYFGRGNVLDNFQAIKFDKTSEIDLYRRSDNSCESMSRPVSVTEASKLRKAIVSLAQSKTLHDIPTGSKIADGYQWIVWVKQPNREKVGYFDNSFPNELVEFARKVDSVIDFGIADDRWESCSQEGSLENSIWDAVERRKGVNEGDD